MTLEFNFQMEPRTTPSLPLGGRWVQPRPVIPVTFIGPARSWCLDCLLDSGADETVLPTRVAVWLGIDLTHAPSGTATAVGHVVQVRYALVTVRLANPHEQREWQAWLAFTSANLRRPLLGFGGFQQYFDVLFRNAREVVELTVNALYPGT